MTPNEWILAIDFGTSNTAAAHTNPVSAAVEPINLRHDRTTMSSAVYMEDAERVEVGDIALNKAEVNPAGFIPSPKRLIPQQVFQLHGYEIPSSVPVSAVLRAVISRASREHGSSMPSQLVLTHPEAWSQQEVGVLVDAAVKAGIDSENIRTISEPQAAAQYYSRAREFSAGEKIAVFDFGGGTLDIAVLESRASGTFEVIAAHGINTIGGKSLDGLMRKWVDTQLEDSNPELLEHLRTRASLSERFALEDSIRRAKELLSETSHANINVLAGAFSARLQMTRQEFEALISPVVNRAVSETRATLLDAGISAPDQLMALYLTGGSSSVPLIQEKLKELGPVATLDNPKTVVALGALHRVVSDSTRSTGLAQDGVRTGQVPRFAHVGQSQQFVQSTPAPQSVPQTPSSQDSGKSRTGLFIGVGIGAIVLLSAAAMYLIPDGFGSGEKIGQAGVESSAVQSVGATNQASDSESTDGVPKDIDTALSRLPNNLGEGMENCSLSEISGTVVVGCSVSGDSPSSKFMSVDSVYSMMSFTFGDLAVKGLYAGMKQTATSDIYPEAEIVKSEDGKKVARLSKTISSEAYTLEYANVEDMFSLSGYDFASKDAARQFLNDNKLL